MSNFIWIGSIVRGNKSGKYGQVLYLDKAKNVACVRGDRGYWFDSIEDLKVISNKEVG